MNGRIVLRVLFALVLIVAAVGAGVYVYNLGVAQGLADSGKLVAPVPGGVPYPYYGGPFLFRPLGFGFGFLGCVFPLLFLLLFFGMLRGIVWRGRWALGGHHGHWDKGAPPMFEEWHRKMHESQTTDK